MSGLDAGSVNARLGADLDPAGFDRWQARLDRAKTAAKKPVKVRLGATVDASEFDKWEARVLKAARASNDVNAKLGATIDETGFDRFEQRLTRLRLQRADVRVKVDAVAAIATLIEVERRLRRVSGVWHVRIDISTYGANPVTLLAQLRGLSSAGAGGGGGGSPGASFGALGGILGRVGSIVAALLPLFIALAGAAVALGASLTAAAAGAAAVAAGLAAALGPIAAVGGAIIARVGAMSEAYKALGEQQEKSGATARASAQAQRAAAQAVGQAEQALGDARRNGAESVARAEQSLVDVRRDGARQVADAELAVADAREQGAQQIAEAERALADAREQGARDVEDAERALADARMAGSERVRSAEDDLADALEGARSARDALTDAEGRAVRERQDLARSAKDAAIDEEGAQIRLERAREHLAKLVSEGGASSLDLRDARHDVKVAEDAVGDAALARKRADEDQARGTDTVKVARDALALANRRVHDSELALHVAAADAAETRQKAERDLRAAIDDSARARSDAERRVAQSRGDASQAETRARQQLTRATQDASRASVRASVAVGQAAADAARQTSRAAAQVAQARAAQLDAITAEGAGADDARQKLDALSDTERRLVATARSFAATLGRAFAPATDAIFGSVDRGLKRVEPLIGRYRGRLTSIGQGVADLVDRGVASLTGPKWVAALDSFAATADRIVKPIGESIGHALEIVRDIAVAAQPYVVEFADYVNRSLDRLAGKTADAGRISQVVGELVDHTKAWWHLMEAVAVLVYRVFNGGATDGKSLVETLTQMVDRWSAFLATEDGQDAMRRFFRDSIDLTKTVFGWLAKLAEVFTDLMEFISEHQDAITMLAKAYVVFRAAVIAWRVAAATAAFVTGGWTTAFWALNAALAANPIGAVVAAAFALGVALGVASKHLDFFGGVARTVFRWIEGAAGDAADVFLGFVTGFLGGLSSIASAASHLPIVGGKFKGLAEMIDGARAKIDGYRESLRHMGEGHKAAVSPITRMLNEVEDLRTKLDRLEKGSDAYNQTAERLRRKQRQLNDAMGDAQPAGVKGARGPRALGSSAAGAARTVDEANAAIVKGYNQLAKQLGGIKHITYTESGVTLSTGAGDVTADTGDITAREVGGWIGSPGERGGDDVRVMMAPGTAVYNAHQQPIVDLARQLAGLGGLFASGGMVPALVGRGEYAAAPGEADRDDRAMRATLGFGLDDLFAAVQRPHYLARGGYTQGAVPPTNPATRDLASEMFARGFSVTSGLRSSGGTYHQAGSALDFGDSVNDLDAVWDTLFPRRAQFAELFGPRGLYHGARRFIDTGLQADHNDHVHVALLTAMRGILGRGSNGGAGAAGSLQAPRIGGPAGTLRSIAQRAVDRVTGAANSKLGVAAGPGVAGKAGSNRQVRSWIAQGLKLAGVPATAANINTLYGRVMQESGGNPRAVNLWDSNARAGYPSRGLLQTIPQTFSRYKVKGHDDINNPVDNVAAAVRYMLATYGHLVGAGRGGYALGGRVAFAGPRDASRPTSVATRRVAPALGDASRPARGDGSPSRLAAGGYITSGPYSNLRKTQGRRVKAYDDAEHDLGRLQADYRHQDRTFNLTEETLVADDGSVDQRAVDARADELSRLLAMRQRIVDKLAEMRDIISRIMRTYRTIISRLREAMKAIGRKSKGGRDRISTYKAAIKDYEGELGDWADKRDGVFDSWRDAKLDVAEVDKERRAVLGTRATVEPPTDDGAPASDGGDGPSDDGGGGDQAGPTAAQIAEGVAREFAAFNASREQLFGQHGSNIVDRGVDPFGGPTGLAAGMQYFGAAGGRYVAPGGVVVENATFNANYPAPPPDGSTYIRQQQRELGAQFT